MELEKLFEGVDDVDPYVRRPGDPEGSCDIFPQELSAALETWVRSYTPEHGVEQVVSISSYFEILILLLYNECILITFFLSVVAGAGYCRNYWCFRDCGVEGP